jgi:ABC-type polysaccharide/polyol phosphate transport system ATPase subunit
VSRKFTLQHERPRSFQELVVNRFRHQPREEFWALRDVSFSLAHGETVGLIGPNGAGKSTVLKLVSRIIKPTAGRIEIDGKVSALLELGAGFHPDLTGRENVYLTGSIMGFGRAEMRRKLDAIVAFAELEHFIDMPVKHYSSGMYVRLAFSVAVHTDPNILLVDEVLAVGDASFQAKCLTRVRQLQGQGTTIMLVSHSMDQVASICKRALWFQDGQVRSMGIPIDIIADYLTTSLTPDHAAVEMPSPLPEPVRHERGAPSPDAQRWGTGQIVIQAARLLRADGQPGQVFGPDEAMRIEFDYTVQAPTPDTPAFGVGVYRQDGLWCYGTHTALEAFQFSPLPAAGTLSVDLPRLQLLQGHYTIDVAVNTPDGMVAFDYIRGCLQFEVRNPKGDMGVFRPQVRWTLHPREDENGE